MMMFPNAPMPQLICLSPQIVSGLVDSLTKFIHHSMKEASANIAQFVARCPPPCQPPPSRPHVCPLTFPAPKPRRRRRRRRRRPRTPHPLPSSFDSLLSTEVDEVIRSIEQLPVAKSTNQEEKRFRRFDMLRMCKTIDVLAKMYSPNHPQRKKPPHLAIEHQSQSQSQESAKAEVTTSNAQESALQLPPGVVITDVADMIKFGVKNLLAIAVATEINFKEAENVKKIIAKTEPPLNKVERGHVTGAQSTLSPAAECSSSTLEEISCSKGEKHSIEEFDYNESTGTFSLRERDIIFATPKLKAEALAQYRAATQSTSSTIPPQPPKTARPQSRELKTGLTLTLKLLRTSAPESPS